MFVVKEVWHFITKQQPESSMPGLRLDCWPRAGPSAAKQSHILGFALYTTLLYHILYYYNILKTFERNEVPPDTQFSYRAYLPYVHWQHIFNLKERRRSMINVFMIMFRHWELFVKVRKRLSSWLSIEIDKSALKHETGRVYLLTHKQKYTGLRM